MGGCPHPPRDKERAEDALGTHVLRDAQRLFIIPKGEGEAVAHVAGMKFDEDGVGALLQANGECERLAGTAVRFGDLFDQFAVHPYSREVIQRHAHHGSAIRWTFD